MSTEDDRKHIHISAVGEALVALERELADLEREDERLIARRRLVYNKMSVCHTAIRDLLLKAGGQYATRTWPSYPELSNPDGR